MEKMFLTRLVGTEDLFFMDHDSEKLFKKNLKTQPNDWIYRNKKIVYSHNEHGFREKSFNTINWKESVVIFGCSNVAGIGVAEEDTISKQLEKIIERPVINLGVRGSGVDTACWNSLILHENFQTPKAVIQIWSSLDRYSDYNKNGLSLFLPNSRNYYFPLNWSFRAQQYIFTDRALWRDKVAYLEGTFFKIDDEIIDVLKIERYRFVDYGRDMMHPGIETNLIVAKNLAKKLEKLI